MISNLIISVIIMVWCGGSITALEYTPLVETRNGLLIGEVVNNGAYYAFRSIPYAEPPIDELRFEAPVAVRKNWTGILVATETPDKCVQWATDTAGVDSVVGSEDCLYVNVYVPHALRAANSEPVERKLPVLVFIHGGGLMWGSSDFYGEQWLMQHGGVILVTFNYRLGPFGFLSTEDTAIAGNMGFKDQAMALQWTYENIKFFTGDPQKILLSGWSAGGASVHFHMVSDMTNAAWFRAAVSFSGTALCPCHAMYEGAALRKARQLAAYLNCSSTDLKISTAHLKDCIQQVAAHDIAKQIPKFYSFSHHPFAIFGPVIEHDAVEKKFLTQHVEQLMRSGKTKSIPWLLGYTAEDGAFGTAEFLKRDDTGRELIYELNDNWLDWAPIMLFFNESWPQSQRLQLAAQLREQYFGTKDITPETYNDLERLFNDLMSVSHIQQTVELYANYSSKALAYGYVYDNPAPYGFGQIFSNRDDWKFGTLHGDDLFLIFNTTVRQSHPLREDEQIISKHLINLLVQMAKTGVPVYDAVKLKPLESVNQFKFSYIRQNGLTL